MDLKKKTDFLLKFINEQSKLIAVKNQIISYYIELMNKLEMKPNESSSKTEIKFILNRIRDLLTLDIEIYEEMKK